MRLPGVVKSHGVRAVPGSSATSDYLCTVHGMHWIEHMDAHAMSLRPFTTSSVKKLYGLQPESVYAEEENPNPSFHPLPTQGRVNEH